MNRGSVRRRYIVVPQCCIGKQSWCTKKLPAFADGRLRTASAMSPNTYVQPRGTVKPPKLTVEPRYRTTRTRTLTTCRLNSRWCRPKSISRV